MTDIDLDPPLPSLTWGANRYLQVEGERVHVVERGMSGPRLLLVHGYASNALGWRAVMDRLDGRFRMAAADMVGWGWSSRRPSRPLTGDTYGERLAGILDALGWDRAHVGGQSWGGGLALRLAAAHPERVERLALLATVDPGQTLHLGTAGLRLAMRFPRLARWAVARAQRVVAEGAGVRPDELAHGYVDPLLLPGSRAVLDRFVTEHATSSHLDLSRIIAPTLVIGPLDDRVVPPPTTRSVADRILGAVYQPIPGAGHSVAWEFPDLVATRIAAFLTEDAAAEEIG